jgi:hypothetical protein
MLSEQTHAMENDGRHDFDFFYGTWDQVNRKRVRVLDPTSDWIEFKSFSRVGPVLGGLGNVDTFDAPDFPGRPGFKGASFRLFDPETGIWRIWWASTIGHGQLDAPVEGRFENGVGIFDADDVLEGTPIRVRFTWRVFSPEHARWEQSFSFDGGETWDTNWTTDHHRAGDAAADPTTLEAVAVG